MSVLSRSYRPMPVAWVAALMVLAAAPAARAQDGSGLRWRFQPGQTLRYEFHQRSELKDVVDGQTKERVNDLTIVLSWKVESVDDAGTATISQTIDRVRAEVKAESQAILYDSTENKAEGPGASSLTEYYGAALGANYSLKVAADGRVIEATVPEEVTAALRNSPFRMNADGGSVFSSEGLIRMLGQVMPHLPSPPAGPPESWKSELEIPSGPLDITLVTTYQLAGTEADVATLKGSIDTAIRPRSGVPFKVEVTSQSGLAEYHFDTTAGSLRSANITQNLALVFSMMEQKSGEQTIAVTLSFKALGEGG